MSGRLPDQVDLHRAVAGAWSFAGTIALREMPRLRSVLCEPAGEARFTIVFGRDREGRATVRGTLRAMLPLQCQRCLRPFGFPVAVDFALAVVTRSEQTDELPEHYDPLLSEDGAVQPRELIEDELLLAVPLIPKHPSEQCAEAAMRPAEDGAETRQANPFAVLADWRRKRTN